MPSFKETYEAIKEDVSKGEKNFNVSCEMLSEGMQCKVTMGESKHEELLVGNETSKNLGEKMGKKNYL